MSKRTRLLLDGIVFQLASIKWVSKGIDRLWSTIIPHMAQRLDILVLDRGNAPVVRGVDAIPFAARAPNTIGPTAAESIAIEQLCRHWGANVFASTYYSTPLSTPAIQMVYDMIPEALGMDLSFRDWQEKELALLYGRAHVCISNHTRTDLLRFYPETDPERTTVAHCGVDPEVFFPRTREAIEAFRKTHRIGDRYLMMTGNRSGLNGYKNGHHFLDALAGMPFQEDLYLLFVGGEPDPAPVEMGGRMVPMTHVSLSDEELATAYSGAEALVYPSLYEGFGMPPAEAMACGCPVIATGHGSLGEVVGDAAIRVSGRDVEALRRALSAVRDPHTRARLIKAGLERAAAFRWDKMAEHFSERTISVANEARDGRYSGFLQEWAKLRRIQADVDY